MQLLKLIKKPEQKRDTCVFIVVVLRDDPNVKDSVFCVVKLKLMTLYFVKNFKFNYHFLW